MSGGPDVSVVFENGLFTNILPAWRGVLPTRVTAEVVYQKLMEWYSDIDIDTAEHGEGWALLRMLTPVAYEVTPAVGDILRMGVEVRQQYGETISVSLFTKRLACLNGMLSNKTEFSWKQRLNDAGAAEFQALWLQEGIVKVVCSYTHLIEKAKLMAETYFEGDPSSALKERATAMGLPKKYVPHIITAFEEEPGNSEWHLLNAFSRFATHSGIEPETSRDIMLSSGDWAEHFEMCSARLPRPLAVSVGARILEGVE